MRLQGEVLEPPQNSFCSRTTVLGVMLATPPTVVSIWATVELCNSFVPFYEMPNASVLHLSRLCEPLVQTVLPMGGHTSPYCIWRAALNPFSSHCQVLLSSGFFGINLRGLLQDALSREGSRRAGAM